MGPYVHQHVGHGEVYDVTTENICLPHWALSGSLLYQVLFLDLSDEKSSERRSKRFIIDYSFIETFGREYDKYV